ncbi:MAG TPA: hypothetical protein VF668_09800 [Pyrinomonadaceae bacterium]|jgi:hypothetical protein
MVSAYILAIRNRSGCEVLLAQCNVIDYRRTLGGEDGALHIYDHPGEYILPGGVVAGPGEAAPRGALRPVGDARPDEVVAGAALQRFCELTRTPAPRAARLRKLYETEGVSSFWVLAAEENPWLTLADDQEALRLNNYFRERDAAVYEDAAAGGRLASSWPTAAYGELHALLWTPPAKAAELLSPRGWLSLWQEEQYKRVRRVLPAYRNYNLQQVLNDRRAPSAVCADALQHLVRNPLVTSIQVYKDYKRLSPILTEGVGQIVNAHGEVRLQGRGLRFSEEPLLGASYFVVASNGPDEVVMLRTMLYAGRDEHGTATFVGKVAADDADDADEPRDAQYDSSAEE